MLYLLLFLAGLAGGFIDAIAGGGGLLTVPALLAAGLPPSTVLGTNKFQSVFGTSVAVHRYARAGLTRLPGLRLALLLSFAAAMAGAWAVSVLDKDLLKRAIPWMLASVAVYTALNRRFGLHAGERKLSPAIFATIFGLALGFYDGFFGPGTGSFWTVALVTLMGFELRQATSYTKVANLASNAGALCVFLVGGAVNFGIGGVMIAGQLLGARAGAGLVVRSGAKLIRPIFLAVVFAITVKLLWDAWPR